MTVPNLLAAICAVDSAHPEKVTLVFDQTIASSAPATGVSLRANGVALTVSSAVIGSDTHQVIVTLSGGPAYTAVLDVSYNASTGDWNNASDAVASFTQIAVVNASKVGTASSVYPLSSVITEKLIAAGGIVTGIVSVDLNAIDAELVKEYEPQNVDFGGTFGVTEDLPAGVIILQDLKPLVDGMQVKKNFYVAGHTNWAADAAAEWETDIRTKIGNALANLRTIDASVTLGARVITQV